MNASVAKQALTQFGSIDAKLEGRSLDGSYTQKLTSIPIAMVPFGNIPHIDFTIYYDGSLDPTLEFLVYAGNVTNESFDVYCIHNLAYETFADIKLSWMAVGS